MAAAGLQEGTLTPMDRVNCTGQFHIGGVTFKDWKEDGHGKVDLLRAMEPVVQRLFLPVRAQDRGRRHRPLRGDGFGLGQPTGVGLHRGKAGPRAPAPAAARAPGGGGGWPAGETVNMSIGQGALLVTPMQVARLMAAVANGGVLWAPPRGSARHSRLRGG